MELEKPKVCFCGHTEEDHAKPGQMRKRLPCERNGCECENFYEDKEA